MTASPVADTIHFVLTVDEGDLEVLAERQNTEGERHAALLEITRMIRKRERENAATQGDLK